MPVALIPTGPAVPPWLSGTLKSHEDAIRELQSPDEPSGVLSIATASLPAAASYRSHIVIVSDVPCLAFSDGVHWRKADGTVIV